MSWGYFQRTGDIVHNAQYVGKGYSGYGIYCNGAEYENQRNEGPIPRGRYRIGKAYYHPRLGQFTMNLTPVGHNAHGRTLFRIHGDSTRLPGSASTGCIILSLDLRQMIAESGDINLEVI